MSDRGIVESEPYRQSLQAISKDVRRMDDLLDSLVWALHTNAEQFSRIDPDRNLWLVKTIPFKDMPPLRIWFSLTPDTVDLLLMEVAGDEEPGPRRARPRRPAPAKKRP